MVQPEVRCVEFVETVTDWMEGALDDDRLLLEEHLVFCPHCTDYVRQLRVTTAMLGTTATTSEAPPASARAALLTAFRSRAGRTPGSHARPT